MLEKHVFCFFYTLVETKEVLGGIMKLIKKLLPLLVVLGLVLTGCSSTPAVEETPAGVTGAINVYTRDASSGTREAFHGFIGITEDLTASAIEVSGNGDMAVKVGADTNGIGYVSLTTDFAANNVKALSYNGVEATEENVIAGTYELARPFSYVTRATGDFASDKQEQIVLAFVDYMVNSVEGREVVASVGGIVEIDKGTAWADLAAKYSVLSDGTDLSTFTISTAGSTSVEKAVEASLEAFQALTGVQFVMNQTGSGDGFKRVLGADKDSANAADIGFASRSFKAEETVDQGALNGVVCQDGIAVVVEANNPLTDITKDTVFNIFTGATTTWEELN